MHIQLTNLSKSYPTPTAPLIVLRNLSLSIPDQSTLAILGPSGSGKSTLLNILGTLDTPTSGEVLFQFAPPSPGTAVPGRAASASTIASGVNPFQLPPRDLAAFRSTHIGFVFQDHHLLPQLSALENILLPRLALGSATPADTDRAAHLLDRVGLSDRCTHLPSQLSGGERQRIAIARALVNQPSLLLADEPTGNLDPHTAESIMQLLLDIAAETHAILLAVTHNPALAQRFSKTLTMHEGTLV